uniref:RanBP2-type domain-containing protein n=1 Tax=Cyprinus carpio TaxID=7962 RepID=A0A8C2BI65_CYPCA
MNGTFSKKEGQWDCNSCLLRNDASATECFCCKTAFSTEYSNAASQSCGIVKLIFGSPSPSKEKSPVMIPSSIDEETGASKLKTSGPAVTSQSFSIPTFGVCCLLNGSFTVDVI